MGWLDNFGKADNANKGKTSNPFGAKSTEGTTNKGRAYSPAWNGQFQDGGVIPLTPQEKRAAAIAAKEAQRLAQQEAIQAALKAKADKRATNMVGIQAKRDENNAFLAKTSGYTVEELEAMEKAKWEQQAANSKAETGDGTIEGMRCTGSNKQGCSGSESANKKRLKAESNRQNGGKVKTMPPPVKPEAKPVAKKQPSTTVKVVKQLNKSLDLIDPQTWIGAITPDFSKEGILKGRSVNGVPAYQYANNVKNAVLTNLAMNYAGKKLKLKNLDDKYDKLQIGVSTVRGRPTQMFSQAVGSKIPGLTGNTIDSFISPWTDQIDDYFVKRLAKTNKLINEINQENWDGKPPVRKSGGSLDIIDDDRGQWAHPGKVTRINSNNITMKNVPYDVLGISDTGDTKLMKPGKNYKFKGSRVTEFPTKAQSGKELTKLDQLTNFTNYNKPTKGGWMDNI